MDKKRSDIVSFLYKVFPLYFPAGESALSKKMPGLEKVKERREKEKSIHIDLQIHIEVYSNIKSFFDICFSDNHYNLNRF